MWERTTQRVLERGGTVLLGTRCATVHRDGDGAVAVSGTGVFGGAAPMGGTWRIPVDHVISSMPLPELVHAMDPPAPPHVRRAADELSHRDFLTVALVVPASVSFPDNWIYVHSPEARVGRIQNFGSWSPYMVKDGYTCLGLEYFVNEGDELWTSSDEELIALGARELAELGLVPAGSVGQGHVVRMPKAYPVYDAGYDERVETIRAWLAEAVPNVHPVGRNGMHKYNNQDHSMVTAMLTVENIADGAGHDVWAVNVDEDYHEAEPGAAGAGTGRAAPLLPRRSRAA
jgi:protoporphyrinogen oxidase